MPSSGFSITISAVDAASKNIDAVNKRLAAIRAPADRLQKQFQKFGDLSGLTAVRRGLDRVTGSALTMARAFEPFGVIAGAASIGGLYALATRWGDIGTKLSFASHWSGVAADRLQTLSGASLLAGSSSEALTSGMESLNKTIFDTVGGANPAAFNAFKLLGVTFQDAGRHAIAADKVFDQLNRTISAMKNPQAQLYWAQQVGAESLLPLLIRRPEDNARDEDIARKYGTMNEANIAGAKRFAGQVHESMLAADGLTNSIARLASSRIPFDSLNSGIASVTNWLTKALDAEDAADQLNDALTRMSQKQPQKQKAWPAPIKANDFRYWKGTPAPSRGDDPYAYWLKPETGGKASPGNVRTALSFFESAAGGAWKGIHAAGIVANLKDESGLNPAAVGDNGLAYGIGQWHPDRQADFKRWSGHDIRGSSFAEQLAFVNFEMTRGAQQAAGNRLRAATDAYDSGAAVSRFYERPAAADEAARNRGNLAARIAAGDDAGSGGRVAVDTRITITDARTQVVSSAKGTGNVSTSLPKVTTTSVGISPG